MEEEEESSASPAAAMSCGTLWGHLPLLLRSSSKESLEYILQALWRTRKTGLDAADRGIIRGILHLHSDSDLDPRLLTLLLQKFQLEWQNDVLKDKGSLPRLKAMTWNMGNNISDSTDQVAIINLKLQGDTRSSSGDTEVKFQLAKDTLDTMLKSMYFIRDQMSNVDDTASGQGQAQEACGT